MFSFPTPDYVCLAHMALLEIGLRLGQAREGVSHAREGVSHAGLAREGVDHAGEAREGASQGGVSYAGQVR